ETADQQLVAECGFVAGATRRVEHGAVGAVQGIELLSDQLVGGIPADRAVVVVSGSQDHRVSEAALLGKPVLGLCRQLRYRVPGEKLWCDAARGGLLGDGLGTALAELGQFASAMLLRPRAAGAVEAFALIQPSQHPCCTEDPHLLKLP